MGVCFQSLDFGVFVYTYVHSPFLMCLWFIFLLRCVLYEQSVGYIYCCGIWFSINIIHINCLFVYRLIVYDFVLITWLLTWIVVVYM